MFSKHLQALQAYEAQVSSLVRGTSRLEEELHKVQEEKANLLSDLASVRELCVKLDSGKELAARQLTSKSMDLERVRPAFALTFFFSFFFPDLAANCCIPLCKLLCSYLSLDIYTSCKHMHVFQVTGELEDVRSEMELLKKQLASERLTVRNLETLLSTNRHKEFQTQMTASERESELKVLRDRLALADSKT